MTASTTPIASQNVDSRSSLIMKRQMEHWNPISTHDSSMNVIKMDMWSWEDMKLLRQRDYMSFWNTYLIKILSRTAKGKDTTNRNMVPRPMTKLLPSKPASSKLSEYESLSLNPNQDVYKSSV